MKYQPNYVRVVKHPRLPLYLYKYTQECVFGGFWDEFTLRARGLVLDAQDNVVGNCIPKFFNIEEHAQQRIPNINFNQPFTVTQKDDGSLIQMFMYEGELVVTSSGGFDNDYTRKAEEILFGMESPLLSAFIARTNRVNFIFELISPLSRVVVNYGDIEELRLITIRHTDGSEDDVMVQMWKELGGTLVETKHFNSIDELVAEKASDYKNAEGFVIRFEDGSRVKVKYDQYFVLHKNVCHLSKKYVWEIMSDNDGQINEDFLSNLPDESFKQIQIWQKEIWDAYVELQSFIVRTHTLIRTSVADSDVKKVFAKHVLDNYKEYSSLLFQLYDGKDITDTLWKFVKPE